MLIVMGAFMIGEDMMSRYIIQLMKLAFILLK